MAECDLCGGTDFSFLFDNHDRAHGLPGRFRVVECNRCGQVTLDPRPGEGEIAAYYPRDKYYSLNDSFPDAGWRAFLYRAVYDPRGSRLLKTLAAPAATVMRSAPVVDGGRFLDVGCGSGQFLSVMKSLGMEAYGVELGEFDEQAAARRGLRIVRGSLESAAFPSDYFDVVTVNHVLEHVQSPARTLYEVHRVLKPGGTAVIGVPQRHSLAYWLFRDCWVQLDVPRHLHTFSTSTIARYVARSGLRVERIRFNSNPFQFTGSLLYWSNRFRKQEKLLRDGPIANRALYALFLPAALACNLLRIGDQVEVRAVKG